ncbi:hypothetical protein E2C01_006132 [Portunus trituberculatus]|uniref:Uncharacterized protein n=1 Tax=Portunus trituberculatus TaxID=210409 RepID=A0A5B7CVH4_PORTR|nr:hypothetical protein [Portunus trituberculatus]
MSLWHNRYLQTVNSWDENQNSHSEALAVRSICNTRRRFIRFTNSILAMTGGNDRYDQFTFARREADLCLLPRN